MKNLFNTCFFFLILVQINAQVLNDDVHIQLKVDEIKTNVSDLTEFGTEDIVLNLRGHCDNAGNNPGWGDHVFKYFYTTGSFFTGEDVHLLYRNNVSKDSEAEFFIKGWESNSDPANQYNGSDHLLEQNQIQPPEAIAGNHKMSQWNFGWNTHSGWLLPSNAKYNVKVKTTWRYAKGTSYANALQFGTIPTGQNRSHINSNRSAPLESSNPTALGYTNSDGQSSPDVYYSFTLPQRAAVTISTAGWPTELDTYIYLIDSDTENVIAFNDDVIPLTNTTSLIEAQPLCAGTYYILVEGYGSNENIFNLSVSTAAISGLSEGAINITPVSCGGGADGAITINPTGGIPPYTYSWASGTNTSTGYTAGVHTGAVYDACGDSEFFTFSVGVDDNTPPSAVCNTLTYTLNPNDWVDIDPFDMAAGSTDNCGISTVNASQTYFSYDDPGTFYVDLTIIDDSENESSCTGMVIIQQAISSSTSDLDALLKFDVFPNPAHDLITVNLEELDGNKPTEIHLINVTGQRVWSGIAQNDRTQIDIGNLAQGMYLVEVRNDNMVGRRQLIVQ